jgi:hypothetical protein
MQFAAAGPSARVHADAEAFGWRRRGSGFECRDCLAGDTSAVRGLPRQMLDKLGLSR